MTLTNITEKMLIVNAVQQIINSGFNQDIIWIMNGDTIQNPKVA
jgi:hypothetical protein